MDREVFINILKSVIEFFYGIPVSVNLSPEKFDQTRTPDFAALTFMQPFPADQELENGFKFVLSRT